jgi:CheY-like chemotaxis protein
VLFADDEPAIRRTGRQMLEHFGFSVIEAANGREAVKIFEAKKDEIVAIVLDMTMPEMSGEEAFREVRRIRSDVVVILSSGYNEVEATRRFTSKGLAGFLQKPYSPEDLAEKLATALAKKA